MFDYVFHGPPTTGVNGSASALGIDASSGTVYYTDLIKSGGKFLHLRLLLS